MNAAPEVTADWAAYRRMMRRRREQRCSVMLVAAALVGLATVAVLSGLGFLG